MLRITDNLTVVDRASCHSLWRPRWAKSAALHGRFPVLRRTFALLWHHSVSLLELLAVWLMTWWFVMLPWS